MGSFVVDELPTRKVFGGSYQATDTHTSAGVVFEKEWRYTGVNIGGSWPKTTTYIEVIRLIILAA